MREVVKTSATLDLANPLGDVPTMRALLDRQRGELMKALVSKIDPDQFIRVALTTAQRRPELLACDGKSFLCAIMESAQMGLLPDNSWGTHLVPFRDKAGRPHVQLIISYRGLLKLVRRSGEIARISAEVVREGDVFQVTKGSRPDINHVPGELEGPLTHVYALAVLYDKNGQPLLDLPQFEVMTRAQVDAIRARSKARDSGPWVTDYDDMARKTVLRKLCKYLPVDPVVEKALSLEDRPYAEAEKVANVLPTLQSFFKEKEKQKPKATNRKPKPEPEPEEADYEFVTTGSQEAEEAPENDPPEAHDPEASEAPEEQALPLERQPGEEIEEQPPASENPSLSTPEATTTKRRGRPPLPRDEEGRVIHPGPTPEQERRSRREEQIQEVCELVKELSAGGYTSHVPRDIEGWSADNIQALVRTLTLRRDALKRMAK